jgi:hypothetical protein
MVISLPITARNKSKGNSDNVPTTEDHYDFIQNKFYELPHTLSVVGYVLREIQGHKIWRSLIKSTFCNRRAAVGLLFVTMIFVGLYVLK